MDVNKVDSVKTLALVARELGRDEEWLFDIAAEMEPEDGLIWVFGPDYDGGAMAFTPRARRTVRSLAELQRASSGNKRPGKNLS